MSESKILKSERVYIGMKLKLYFKIQALEMKK